MSVGKVELDIRLKAKQFNNDLNKMQSNFSKSVNSLKTTLIAAKLGSLLFQGAQGAIAEYMAKMRLIANLNELGFGKEQANRVAELSDSFEKIGYSADVANDAFTQFIATGRSTVLRSVGVYLDKNTQSILTQSTAQQRLNFLLGEGRKKLVEQQKAMPQSIAKQLEFKKAVDDTQKALGVTFMQTLAGVINAIGGVGPALKAAIIVFTAYKSAMILGNVGIGISKAIAQGGVFLAPLAIAMGAVALATIGAMIGTAAYAVSSIPSASANTPEVNSASNIQFPEPTIKINVTEDRYGKEVRERSGNNNGRVIN